MLARYVVFQMLPNLLELRVNDLLHLCSLLFDSLLQHGDKLGEPVAQLRG